MRIATRNIPFRVAFFAAAAFGVAALGASRPAHALVVEDMTGTTVAPADDPGWNFVTGSGSRAYVYLGDGWALSASHVGVPAAGEMLQFPTGSFGAIPNQSFIVHNPAGSGLTADTDLRLIRINGDVGTPSFAIASQQVFETTPIAQRQVTIIGPGPSRQANPTYWNVQVVSGSNNDIWTEVTPPASFTHQGYKSVIPTDDVMRWGTNQITDEDSLVGSNDNDLRFSLQLQLGVGPRDVMSMVTKFDSTAQGGLTNEVQVVAGDSGSAVFYKRNNQWELIGIVNAVYSTFENQSNSNAVYGNYTTFADLSYYRNEIMSIIDSHPDYSLMGDINLDGSVSGTGAGPQETDDVTAFVDGWMYQQEVGDINSWKKGDLNLDGITDVNDFFLLRSALNPSGTGAGLSLASLLANGGVPEPSSALLALAGAALLALRRNRRRFAASL